MATQNAYWTGTDTQVEPGEIIHDFKGFPRTFERVVRDSELGIPAQIRVEESDPMSADVFPVIEVR